MATTTTTATASWKPMIHRPASAMSKLSAPSNHDSSRPPVSMSNRGERRRSLPAPAPLSPADAPDTDSITDELPQLSISARSLYEKRRTNGLMSPTLTSSSARSTNSDRGSDRVRDRSYAGTDETFSIHRLRSNSGLSLHTNSAALRRYTDYNADGSSRLSPTDERLDSDGRFKDEVIGGRNVSHGYSSTSPTSALFSWETVRAILDDPVARGRLWEYTRNSGGAENLDFLEKIEEYNKALHNVTALMATISTKFTCVTASEPLKLPPQLAKSLNTDVKHVSSSILPGLEMLFGDVDAHIKERVLRQIYPNFAKRQLGLRMKASLGAPSAGDAETPFRFEGLGRAFCLTDPYRPDNPIVYASDSFAHVLGYARSEDIPRTGRFFRGPEHSYEDNFTEDLVLSRNHKDNRPFWSLVSVCPLKTANGRVRFILSGLVDITDAVKSREDIVHALSAVAPTVNASSHSDMNSINDTSRGIYERPTSAVKPLYDETLHTQRTKSEKAQSKSFFQAVFSEAADGRELWLFYSVEQALTEIQFSWRTLPSAPRSPNVIHANAPGPTSPLADDKLAIYSRFMVLQFVPGSSHSPNVPPASRRGSRHGSSSMSAAPEPGTASRLKIAFSSLPMLELLGLGAAAQDAVMYHDVFAVLSELAGSPSITPVFRANVRQRIVTSESASLELAIPASGVSAPGAFSARLGAGLATPNNDETGPGNGSRRSSMLISGRARMSSRK